jgi:hypothetical protein
VSEGTVRDFEKRKRVPAADKLSAIRAALELAGVTFLADDGHGGAGARLRKSTTALMSVRDGEAGIIENSDM